MGYMKVSYQSEPIRTLGKIKYSHSSYKCMSSKLNILSSKEDHHIQKIQKANYTQRLKIKHIRLRKF